MPEMHLKQPGFTYSACGLFTKIKKEFKNLRKQEIQDIFTDYILIYIYIYIYINIHILILVKKLLIKILNLKLVIM